MPVEVTVHAKLQPKTSHFVVSEIQEGNGSRSVQSEDHQLIDTVKKAANSAVVTSNVIVDSQLADSEIFEGEKRRPTLKLVTRITRKVTATKADLSKLPET